MKRDFAALSAERHDLLVLGGGVYGAWIALDAARRGLSVALIEQSDWGAGTSSASSKLIHGGLRYLQYMQFGLVRKSLKERRRLAHLGPHRVWPLRFLLPVYRGARVGRLRLGLGLKIYDLLAGTGSPVARSRSLGRAALLERYDYLQEQDLRGGFVYGDCGTDDARLVLEVVAGALQAEAVAVNHARATELLRHGGKVQGARVRDQLSGAECEVQARLVVNAAGPWAAGLLPPKLGRKLHLRLIHGSHLVMPALPQEDAFLLDADDGRVFFLIPWYGRTLVGTTESDFQGDPATATVPASDVEYLLRNVRRRLPGLEWSESDVCGRYAGLRTLRAESGASASELSREWSLEEPERRLLHPVGGKLTSAREDAAKVVDRVVRRLGLAQRDCATDETPMPWCPPGNFAEWLNTVIQRAVGLGVEEGTAMVLARRYGSTVDLVLQRIAAHPQLSAPIVAGLPFVRAELEHAREHEMACTEDDVLRRRIPLRILHPHALDLDSDLDSD